MHVKPEKDCYQSGEVVNYKCYGNLIGKTQNTCHQGAWEHQDGPVCIGKMAKGKNPHRPFRSSFSILLYIQPLLFTSSSPLIFPFNISVFMSSPLPPVFLRIQITFIKAFFIIDPVPLTTLFNSCRHQPFPCPPDCLSFQNTQYYTPQCPQNNSFEYPQKVSHFTLDKCLFFFVIGARSTVVQVPLNCHFRQLALYF